MTNFTLPIKEYKSAIRKVLFSGDLYAGGESGAAFVGSENKSGNKPIVALEVLFNQSEKVSPILQGEWENKDIDLLSKTDCDALAVKFNLNQDENIKQQVEKAKEFITEVSKKTNKHLIIRGCGKDEIDIKLLPELALAVDKKCTFGCLTEDNYSQIIPSLTERGHNVIAQTPIDINLAKQLNILLVEAGVNPDRILIDPTTGALGYGLDYAYSMTERIKLAGLEGDEMLNMPIISFVGEETWKTKEAKSQDTPPEWGDIKERSIIWEAMTAVSMICAGANVVVLRHSLSLDKVKKFVDQIS